MQGRFQAFARLEAPGWMSAAAIVLFIGVVAVWANIIADFFN
ncbi:MAG TPA: hypothetical protein VGC26_03330 [Afipia sp.]